MGLWNEGAPGVMLAGFIQGMTFADIPKSGIATNSWIL